MIYKRIPFFRFTFFTILVFSGIFTSCNDDDGLVTHRICDEVETEITAINYQVGSYNSSSFSNINSSDFAEAAISMYIEDWTFTADEDGDCYTFTALPQSLAEINIKSSSSMTFDGVVYDPEDELIGLFKIYSNGQAYTAAEFVNIQNDEPSRFDDENDEVIFQLLNKPDVAIDQPLVIHFTFDDSKIFEIEIPKFEVMN